MTVRRFQLLLENFSSESPLSKLLRIRDYKPVKNYKNQIKENERKMRELQNIYRLV